MQIRTNQVGDPNGPKTAAEFFNTSAFTLASGAFGTESPGALMGPGFQLWDMALNKNFRFGERVRFQLRLETFNTFNHGSPLGAAEGGINTLLSPSNKAFGTVTGYHDPRNLQLGAKLEF